jgi:hypothetical protein
MTINQTKCWVATEGRLWMQDYFDALPVRQRMRASPFNLCPACLVTEFLPKLRRKHPNTPREKLLFDAIEVMESEMRKGK